MLKQNALSQQVINRGINSFALHIIPISHRSLASGSGTVKILNKYMMCFIVLMLRYRKPQSSYHHEHLCYNKWCHGSCGALWCHLMCRWGQLLSNGMVTISQEFRITIHFLAGNPESPHFSIKAWCDFKPLERSSISNWSITRPILQAQTVSVS